MKINQNLRNQLKILIVKRIKAEGENSAVIETPYLLSQDELSLFTSKFHFLKNCQIENIVNDKLIGGYIIKHGSEIIDGSLATRINNIIVSLKI
ncbi:hypothetical protein A3C23_02495 [Candidatus Roizmanbacteria bacterium RIFCSPHIGHO2_02_FULL_37_13b]|uniref:Uncharacterized protein n=1 Tax=Candidatus Roizmanbacteria bacterium RIFCSPLOWO2_02_FULL_36_11 TaxID=1802071 RepID=A0A1F7JG62_9BACT|nr:MAG: hypothetical protein A3C23_02495 [Candidatus Roizmanbacteria bacterium RIFCSPHIGHO2_02_FULL_37_13b]OGK54546.1 MAG: hypothetical protein A3H78_01505 [Candidatus Roizmanbacteria bacterium RIFCSPLOWO2_02_FULL_36_11]